MSNSPIPPSHPSGSPREVLLAFLRLGCISFGGPIAHLGYFHREFVERRQWCDSETFAEIVALAQSMPGPASSQVGFALGVLRAGWGGGAAAWFGFTMPSALLMLAFAYGHTLLTGKLGAGIVHGLQVVAVAVVAQAILAMRKSLAPDLGRMALALLAAAIVLFFPMLTPMFNAMFSTVLGPGTLSGAATLLAIAAGALLGLLLPRPLKIDTPNPRPTTAANPNAANLTAGNVNAANLKAVPPSPLRSGVSTTAGVIAAITFAVILLLLLIPSLSGESMSSESRSSGSQSSESLSSDLKSSALSDQRLAVFSAFYRTGAMVFGGGHVVLPLLEHSVVSRGWVDQQTFLSGYGAAQAIPGPLFTFAAFLGAVIRPTPNPIALSAIALIAIFLPGLLIMVAVLPFWSRLHQSLRLQSALRGVNAAVIGVLIAAFIRPVFPSAVHSAFDLALALLAFASLVRWKLSPWIVVVAIATIAAAASYF
jgi:chromate transporter